MSDEDTTTLAEGSVVRLTRVVGGWKMEILHEGGGMSGRLAPFPSIEDAVAHLRKNYDIDDA